MPPDSFLGWNGALRLKKGDVLFLRSQASVLATLNYTARFARKSDLSDAWDEPLVDQATSSTRTTITQDTFVLQDDRYLMWLKVSDQLSTNVLRGTLYIEVYVGKGSAKPVYTLIGDYLSTDHYPQWPGTIVERGPGGGDGALTWVSLAANIAPVDVTRVLAITNAFRRIHGFVWYYNASADAASRVLSTRLRQPGLALPTGLTTAIGVWNAANLTLTASEEGIVFVMRNRSILNDNSNDPTTIDSTATAPTPFPYDATEDDLADLFFDVTDANANDRHSIYLLQEEWLSI